MSKLPEALEGLAANWESEGFGRCAKELRGTWEAAAARWTEPAPWSADTGPGYLLVGTNDRGEVVINLDHDRTGHIVFSPEQAEGLAGLLLAKAADARGEPASLADWREAVAGALPCSGLLNCYIDREVGEETHSTRCAAYYLSTVLSALAPLVLAERLRAERLRYALEQLLNAYATATSRDDTGHPVDPRYAWGKVALTAAPPSPDDDALAELVGLPQKAEVEGAEQMHKGDDLRHEVVYARGLVWIAGEVRALLRRLSLPAGEER